MQRVHSRAWVCTPAQTKMRNIDDVFRGFIRSPDGGVILEIELLFADRDSVLSIDIYIPENLPQDNCCKDLTQEN